MARPGSDSTGSQSTVKMILPTGRRITITNADGPLCDGDYPTGYFYVNA
jgi:hypothetical protein